MVQTEYRFDRYRLLPAARELWLDDTLLSVPRLVFDCLAYLVEHRDRAIGRDELVAAVWGRVDVVEARVSELVLRARRVIGDDGQVQRAIRTVPGYGYRWVIATDAVSAPSADGDDPPTAETDEADRIIAPDIPEASAIPHAAASPSSDTGFTTTAELTGPQTHSSRASRTRALRRPWWMGASIIALAIVATYLGVARFGREPAASSEPIRSVMVLPLSIDAPREAGWVRLGAMDLIADRLRSAGLPVLPSESVLMALGPATEDFADLDVAALERRLGAGPIVQGHAILSTKGWRVALTTVGAQGHKRTAEAEGDDVIAAARQAADRLLSALGYPPAANAKSTEPADALLERLQQAQAAILASDLDQARTILDGLPEEQRNDPRVRFHLGQIELFAGRLDQADAKFGDVLAAGPEQSDPVLHGRAIAARATVQTRRGDFHKAERDFSEAVAMLQNTNAARELGRALSGRGHARVALGQFDAASADLGQARIQFQQAGDRPGVAQVDVYFGLLEAERGRYDLALPYLIEAAGTFEAYGVVERTVVTLIALLDAQSQLLRWTDALATSDRQWALRERIDGSDPVLSLIIVGRRGRVLAALGRHREAERLLADAEVNYADVPPRAARYLYDFRADLAARRGQWKTVVEAVDRALAIWPADPGYDRYSYLLLLRQRGLVAGGEATAEQIERVYPPADAGKISPILDVARAEWAAYQGRIAEAESYFEAALTTAETRGMPGNIVLVAVSYGQWLLAHQRFDRASALAGRVAPWADRDFECALLQVSIFHALGQREPWMAALGQVRALAGEREIPAKLLTPPAF